MRRILTTLFLAFSCVLVMAQGYNHSIGIRGGISSGFTYRFFTDDLNSYTVLLSTNHDGPDRGTRIHALKEFHRYDLFSFSEQLVFYFGAGIHAGFESWDVVRYRQNISYVDTKTSLIAGLDGLAGLDYVFYEVPLSVGMEVKPYFDILGREVFGIQLFDFAFTVKYLF